MFGEQKNMDEELEYISDAELLKSIEQAETDDDSFLPEEFKNFLEEDEKYEFNLNKEINNFIAVAYDEYEKALEAKKIADYLAKHGKKLIPYMNIKQVFTASGLYFFMREFDERITQRTITTFCQFLNENLLLRMKADIVHKITKRNIQLFWLPGTPKKKIIRTIRYYLEINSSKKSQEEIKMNQKNATKAIMEGAKEGKQEFLEEQTAIHREKQKTIQQEVKQPQRKPKTTKTKIHEEKKELIMKEAEKMIQTGKPIDPEKELRDKKIAEEQWLRKQSTRDLVKGIYSDQFQKMPTWYQDMAKNIFKERTGSEIFIE